MDRRIVGAAQLRAHRYGHRRLGRALTLGTTLPPSDPGRTARRCTLGSFVLAVALLAAAGVWAAVRPAPDWSGDEVLLVTDSGTLLVHRDGVLYPALNLTSALLARDDPGTSVRPVPASALVDVPRGATIGIVGAPAELPGADRLVRSGWSLCDDTGTATTAPPDVGSPVTTAVIGSDPPGRPLTGDEAVLVNDADDPHHPRFLLWAGRRIPVDTADRVLTDVFDLHGVVPRPASSAMLAALPTVAVPVVTPLPGAGVPSAFGILDRSGQAAPVGAVLRATRSDGRVTLDLLHRDGLEPVTPVLADLVTARTGTRVLTVDPQALAGLPVTREPTVAAAALPVSAPAVIDAPVVCATWGAETGDWSLTAASALSGPPPLPLQDAGVDQLQVPAGHGAVVRVPSENSDAGTYLVTEQGVAYPLAEGVPGRLGLLPDGAEPPAAPAVVISRLVPGPTLSVDAARIPWRPDAGPDSAPSRDDGGS